MLCPLYDAGEDLPGAVRTVMGDNGVDCLEPFAGLDGIDVCSAAVGAHRLSPINHLP
jgi:hypothetical protein